MKKLVIALILIGVASAGIARPVYRSHGFYAGVLGASASTYNSKGISEGGNRMSRAGYAFLSSAGYQFSQYLAAEMDFAYYKPNASTGLRKVYQSAVAMKGIIPLMDSFSFYGKLGVAETLYYPSGVGVRQYRFKPLVGLGVAYSLSKTVELTLLAQTTVDHYSHKASGGDVNGWDGLSLVGVGVNVYF